MGQVVAAHQPSESAPRGKTRKAKLRTHAEQYPGRRHKVIISEHRAET
jgi:hypothetical protein